MADPPSNNRAAEAAWVEDYNDESETAVPETRKTANITAKRSKPDVTKLQAARDEISDSGHSSQTLATLGSTNSSLASKSASDTIRAESHAAIGKTRTLKVEEKHQRKSRSPEKAQPRRATSTNRKDGTAKAGSATPQHPTKPAAKARAPGPELIQQKKRTPVHFAKEAPIPQNAPPRPRVSTSRSQRRERPQSFHAGAGPEHFYSQLIEPPPTVRYSPIASIVTPSYSPHPNSYFPSEPPIHQSQAPPLTHFYPSPSSPFEQPARPRPRQWASEFSHPPRPQSMIYTTTPIYECVPEPVYTPILPPMQPPSRQSSHRERLRALPELRTARGEDCYTMPPPAPAPPPRPRTGSEQGRRPAMRHAMTADIHSVHAHHRAVRDESTTGHVGHESPVKQSYNTYESAPRPRRNTSDEIVPSTHGKHRQQASVYGHESLDKLEESKTVEAVERYQASKGNRRASSYGAMPPPAFTRKKTQTSSKSSETSSRKSEKSGKSRTSRTSKDESDLKSRRTSGDDYFSMRVDASQGVNVDLKGGMEGRRITFRHHKDEGEMEFVIGGAQGRTTTGAERESREKSRRRYSYRNGPSEVEIDRPGATSRSPMKIREKEEGDETEPRIVQERTTTTTRTRARSLRDSSRVREE
ncbi:hypothetical protein BDR22DRAFT_821143 [Usnea florida]